MQVRLPNTPDRDFSVRADDQTFLRHTFCGLLIVLAFQSYRWRYESCSGMK